MASTVSTKPPPQEILDLIVGYLDPIDDSSSLKASALSFSEMRFISQARLFSHVTLAGSSITRRKKLGRPKKGAKRISTPCESLAELIAASPRFAGYVRAISLHSRLGDRRKIQNDSKLPSLLRSFPKLSAIRMQFQGAIGWAESISKEFQETFAFLLESRHITCLWVSRIVGFPISLLIAAPHLRALHLETCTLIDDVDDSPSERQPISDGSSLEHLSLNDMDDLDVEMLHNRYPGSYGGGIKTLILSGVYGFSENVLDERPYDLQLIDKYPGIETLIYEPEDSSLWWDSVSSIQSHFHLCRFKELRTLRLTDIELDFGWSSCYNTFHNVLRFLRSASDENRLETIILHFILEEPCPETDFVEEILGVAWSKRVTSPPSDDERIYHEYELDKEAQWTELDDVLSVTCPETLQNIHLVLFSRPLFDRFEETVAVMDSQFPRIKQRGLLQLEIADQKESHRLASPVDFACGSFAIVP